VSFNRRKADSRGLLFRKLLEQAVFHHPVLQKSIEETLSTCSLDEFNIE